MAYHWSIHQLTEYLVAVSAQTDSRGAMRTALERIGEALEAELGLITVNGEPVEVVGFGSVEVPEAFCTGADGEVVDLPRMGQVHLAVGRLATADGQRGFAGGILVAGRLGEPFTAEERQMLHGMALSLGLLLHTLETLAGERQRHRLVESLLQIQRAISARRPLAEVLDAITSGASGLLGGCPVALLLSDQGPDILTQVSVHNLSEHDHELAEAAHGALADGPTGHTQGVLTEQVVVAGEVVGCLVARQTSAAISGHDPAELLTAFAQQVNLALTDARTLDAVREAHRDPITSLPNRKLLLEHLDRERDAALAEGRPLTVLFIDLDRFKAVNDTLGHPAGDDLLAQVAHRILTCIGDMDIAARLGGDEFAVLVRSDERIGEVVAERIIASLTRPFTVEGRAVQIGASVGVTALRSAEQTSAGLVSDADVAMYCAKRAGRGRWVTFEPAMHAAVADQLGLRTDLSSAVANGELWLAYQPLVELGSGRVSGVEALLRWNHPVRGAVPPSEFVPIAEESETTIRALGRWVIDRALADLATWRLDLPDLHLAINVSSRQVTDPQLGETIRSALAREGLPGDAITLEITESLLMDEPDRARVALEALKQLGVRLAIDDFGTGYSSLSYLRRFPVDQVKIDRSFVAELGHGDDEVALVRSILDLCRTLRLQTVAEGIEDAEQLAILTDLGCDLGQGYLLARPAPAAQAPHRLPRSAPVGTVASAG